MFVKESVPASRRRMRLEQQEGRERTAYAFDRGAGRGAGFIRLLRSDGDGQSLAKLVQAPLFVIAMFLTVDYRVELSHGAVTHRRLIGLAVAELVSRVGQQSDGYLPLGVEFR